MAEVKGHLGGKEVSAYATINCSLKNLGVQGKEKWEVGFLFIHLFVFLRWEKLEDV